eukprot:TRINITY_DN41514_c0_g1_i1.p1 TRINITY_DN41514_c0_g1~~TRINITY_DN41514_c0_g1_i1.p1  ORF type:complete len:161 (+),score=22.97 TRINITY_DN41514_c0_g1_i1:62-484(+)
METIRSLTIINKSGGMIYHKDWTKSRQERGNAAMEIASYFFSMHAMSRQVSPVADSGGIEQVEAGEMKIFCFEPHSRSIKIMVTTDPGVPDLSAFMRKVYQLFSDYVLKNPFYGVDEEGCGQPIRLELWETELQKAVAHG